MFIESSTGTTYVHNVTAADGTVATSMLLGTGLDAGRVVATCRWFDYTVPVVVACDPTTNVFLPRLKFDGTVLSPAPFYVNGNPCWSRDAVTVDDVSEHVGVWCSNLYGWVYSNAIGLEPVEFEIIRRKSDAPPETGGSGGSGGSGDKEEADTPGDGYHGGDMFYKLNSDISVTNLTLSSKIRVTPRGTGYGGKSSKTVTVELPERMWEYDKDRSGSALVPYGVYKPVEGTKATGDVVVGVPYWKIVETGVTVYRSLKRTGGHYEYGSVKYVDGTWAIGTPGTGAWWVGSEPKTTRGSKTVFKYHSEDGGGKGFDRTLEFWGYAFGPYTTEIILGQVPVWM